MSGMNTSKTKKYSTKNSSAASSESLTDKAMNRFATMMISRIESIQQDWKKPWFCDSQLQWPRNMNGRFYNGMNSCMLLMHCEEQGFKFPIFCTFDRVNGLNYTRTDKGSKPAVDAQGNKLPLVSVRKGEKSFPVCLTTFTVVNPEDNTKIKYEDYKQLTEEQRSIYNVYPKLQVYYVFNIEQTNMKEARPELFEKLTAGLRTGKPSIKDGKRPFAPLDKMIKENLWICPIVPKRGDDAYYSISKNEIVFPEFDQFVSSEAWASNLFHEMSHSTGCEKYLNRLKPTSFGSAAYAKEELIAELTAALVAQYYGLDKMIKEDSCAYLKSWLDSLKEDPSFIKTLLLDVKRSAAMLTFNIDEVKKTIEAE